MGQALENYKLLKKQRKELEKQIKDGAKVAFHEASQELFAENPKLTSFGWTQYTPYFNNGDECVFSAHTCEPYINGECMYDWGDKEIVDAGMTKAEFKALNKNVLAFLKNFDDAELKSVFGDHVKVSVTKKDVKVTDYDHD